MRGSDTRTDTEVRRRGSRLGATAALVGVLSLTACGSGGDDAAGGDAPAGEAEEDPRVGPDFSAEPAVTLTEHHAGRGEAVLTEETAYLADHGGLTAYDLDNGEERFRVEPAAPGLDAYTPEDLPEEESERTRFRTGLSQLDVPQLVDVAGTDAVLASHLVEPDGGLEGSLLAADAETGEELWSTEIRSDIWDDFPVSPALRVGEAHEGHVVVTVSNGDPVYQDIELTHERFVVALDSGEVVQELGDTGIAGHANGTLYTMDRLDNGTFDELVGRDPVSGSERWRLDLPDAVPAVYGPWIVATEPYESTQLLDVEDRDTVLDLDEGLGLCVYDPDSAMLACDGEEEIVAVNADGEVAWSLPTDDAYARLNLQGGYLYTRPEDDLLALDMTTGEPVSDSLDAEPDAVGPTGALFRDDMTVSFHTVD